MSTPTFAEKRLLDSYYAVAVYGAGHVIAYNKVVGFHDAIDHATYGMPDDYPNTPRDRMPVSIDIYGNDVSNLDDNCFEADGSMHNYRIFHNRCFNVAVGGMSPQPVFGGPVYFIRNVVYHSPYGPVKIHADPSGVVYYHNTYIGEVSQDHPCFEPAPSQQSDFRPAAPAGRNGHPDLDQLYSVPITTGFV